MSNENVKCEETCKCGQTESDKEILNMLKDIKDNQKNIMLGLYCVTTNQLAWLKEKYDEAETQEDKHYFMKGIDATRSCAGLLKKEQRKRMLEDLEVHSVSMNGEEFIESLKKILS